MQILGCQGWGGTVEKNVWMIKTWERAYDEWEPDNVRKNNQTDSGSFLTEITSFVRHHEENLRRVRLHSKLSEITVRWFTFTPHPLHSVWPSRHTWHAWLGLPLSFYRSIGLCFSRPSPEVVLPLSELFHTLRPSFVVALMHSLSILSFSVAALVDFARGSKVIAFPWVGNVRLLEFLL